MSQSRQADQRARMSKVPTNVSFKEWVRCVFDHPVEREAWYWAVDSEAFELNPVRLVAHSSRLFAESASALAEFTNEQIDQGFWFLVGSPTELDVLCSEGVPLPDRLQCIHSISMLFEQCFAVRCTPHLSHLLSRKNDQGVGPLNSSCYMWWDLLWHPIALWRDPSFSSQIPVAYRLQRANEDEIDEACISAMELILELPSIACQESALHGLGHWGKFRHERCRGVIASFLQRHPAIHPKLREYALKAQEAKVL